MNNSVFVQNLKEKRAIWERDCQLISECYHSPQVLFVIVLQEGEAYRLLRYFSIGDNWEVSVDCDGTWIDCLNKMVANLTP